MKDDFFKSIATHNFSILWRYCRSRLISSCVRHVDIIDCISGLAFSGVMSIPHFVKICPAVLELKYADRQTRPDPHAFISCP
jgi:hypothetical protein